jgi:hypothetical protein
MDIPDAPDMIADHQRRALDFMLDALGLRHTRDEAYRSARLMELEQQVAALLGDNHRLRARLAELEHLVGPDEAELDALERALGPRLAGRRSGAGET